MPCLVLSGITMAEQIKSNVKEVSRMHILMPSDPSSSNHLSPIPPKSSIHHHHRHHHPDQRSLHSPAMYQENKTQPITPMNQARIESSAKEKADRKVLIAGNEINHQKQNR
jgi:hypothetical protein